jgi:hypothetical protein
MSDTEQKSATGASSVRQDILQLYDEFAEFNDRCSFLCDAFAGIVANPEYIDENTIHGFSRYSDWLKHKIVEFKARLKHIHERLGHEGR